MRPKYTIPREYLTTNFYFPVRLQEGMAFTESSAIEKHLEEEATAFGFPLYWIMRGFSYHPNHSNWSLLLTRCKFCQASLIFERKNGVIVASSIKNAHHHSELKFRPGELEVALVLNNLPPRR